MSLFKAAVVKIQRGQALVKPLRAGPLTAKIVLDGKNVDIFHPGRDIIGHVEVTYNQEFPFCGLKLTVEGLIHIKYREDKYVFDKKESIWTESSYLIGTYGQTKIRSKAGEEASYAFSFRIPSDMPGSYKSDFGHITYHLSLLLDYGDNKMTKRADRPITLKGQLDLDPDDPATADPVEVEERDQKAVKQVAHNRKSTDGQLRFRFRIEQSGFLSGESIPFLVDVENPRKAYKIVGTKVELIQEVIYHGGKILKKVRTGLASVSQGKKEELTNIIFFDAAEQQTKENQWEGVLQTPRGLFPTTKGDIAIHYFLKVTLSTKTVKLIALCPLTIGTSREGLTLEAIEEASKIYKLENSLRSQETVDED